MSGTSGERCALVIPSARSLPPRTEGNTAGMTEISACTCPAIVSIIAGVTPL
jgi:hypothetical protein